MPFFKIINQQALQAGSVLEIKVTDTTVKEYVSNIWIMGNDIYLMGVIYGLGQ